MYGSESCLSTANEGLKARLEEKEALIKKLEDRINELTCQSNELYEKAKHYEETYKIDNSTSSFINIPQKVRIGSMDYDVFLTDEVLVMDGRQCYGTIDYDKHIIKISNNIQDKQGQEQTFLHELIHGIARERSLELQNEDDETITDEIAIGLHQVIRDNPGIFIPKVTAAKENIYVGNNLVGEYEVNHYEHSK